MARSRNSRRSDTNSSYRARRGYTKTVLVRYGDAVAYFHGSDDTVFVNRRDNNRARRAADRAAVRAGLADMS